MALFGSFRDASLLRSISREVMKKIISNEVAIYKVSLENTRTNIYNESVSKVYNPPVRVSCLVELQDKTTGGDDMALDFIKTSTFYFLRDDLVDINLYVDEGDIIEWDNQYFEIDNIRRSNYWMTRNPDTLLPQVLGDFQNYGYSISITAEAHLTKLSSLNLVDVRSGVDRNYGIYGER